MAQSNGDKLAKDFENIILAWSSGVSGEQREVLAPEAKELVQMLCSSAEMVRKQHELDAKKARVEQNKSLCGCPMCLHHSEAYELKAEREALDGTK